MTDEKDPNKKSNISTTFADRLKKKQGKKVKHCAIGDALDNIVTKDDYIGFLRVIEALRSMADSIQINVEGYEYIGIEATMFYKLGELMDPELPMEQNVTRSISGSQLVSFMFPEFEFDDEDEITDGEEYEQILDETSDRMRKALYALFSEWSVIGSPGSIEDTNDDI